MTTGDETGGWRARRLEELAVREPRVFGKVVRLLCSRLDHGLSALRLRAAVRDFVDTIGDPVFSRGLPRVSPIEVDGHALFLRLYPMEHVHVAALNLQGKRVLARSGLVTPPAIQQAWVYLRRRPVFAFVEERCLGTDIRRLTSLSPIAYELGASLARWHGLGTDALSLGSVVRQRHNSLQRDLEHPPLPGVTRTEAQRGVVDHAASLIETTTASADLVLSQGDIHPSNIMTSDESDVVWIDLDSICIGPRFFFLAHAVVKVLLYQRRSIVEAFFEGYFAHQPIRREAWQREGMRWFVLVCATEGVKWQSYVRHPRAHTGGHARADAAFGEQLRWAETFFMMAETGMESSGRPDEPISETITRLCADVSVRNGGRV